MLDSTTKAMPERKHLRVNPAKTCQPIGAMYAALGVHGCMPHSHGSQGCCAYHRSHLTRHYKEPVVATTSSFTEGASVFGGLANLQQAIVNIFTIYDPEIIAVHTTCLSEVIGDDIPSIIKKCEQEGKIPEGKVVMHTNTPSFVGSNTTGFSNMVTSFITYLAEKSDAPTGKINVLSGWVDPSDMREMRRLMDLMGAGHVLLPDTSDVLDAPQTGVYAMYPRGGTKVSDIRTMGDSAGTLALGIFASEAAAKALEKKCGVGYEQLPLPIGLANTDAFVDAVRRLAGVEVPMEIDAERGRLLDAISDHSQYLHNLKVAIFGDPDTVVAMTRFAVEMGMDPRIVLTGAQPRRFEAEINEILGDRFPNARVAANEDLLSLHSWIKEEPVDLILGNTYAKHIARVEDIPLVRFGFPILDRMSHRLFPTVGYRGAMRILDQIIEKLFDHKDRTCAEEWFELVM